MLVCLTLTTCCKPETQVILGVFVFFIVPFGVVGKGSCGSGLVHCLWFSEMRESWTRVSQKLDSMRETLHRYLLFSEKVVVNVGFLGELGSVLRSESPST